MSETIEAQAQARAVGGIRLSATASGTRYKGRDDLTLIEIAPGSSVQCVFTRNKFCAAPVTIARQHAAQAAPRYLIINAGNANATVPVRRASKPLSQSVPQWPPARAAGLKMLPFSTGVMGRR